LKNNEDDLYATESSELPGEPFESLSDLDSDDELDEVEELDMDALERERRRVAYADLKKNDKIFNNSFTMGSDRVFSEDGGGEHRAQSSIKVDSGSPDYHLYDRDLHSDYVDNSIVQQDIYKFISNSLEVKTILGYSGSTVTYDSNGQEIIPDFGGKKKFTKDEVNKLFEIIVDGLSHGPYGSTFVGPIHVMDVISSLTNIEYKKLFDLFSYDNKEVLLLELNKKHNFLDRSASDFKMYE